MALFITSSSQATTHNVYGLERTPPISIRPVGTGTVAIVEQFPWGPDGEIYTVGDIKDFIDKFCPAGAPRTGAGYLSVIGRAWPVLKVVRAIGPTAAAASATINKTGPVAFIVVALKYKGTLGNSVTCTTSAATDGDANHFNLTVTLTTASGTTIDKFENLNYSGTGADSVPDCTNCILVGSITKSSSGVPIIGSTTCTGGLDGTVTSAEYVGTQGSGDKGAALLEGDEAIDIVITGDPGNSLRAAVNAGLVAHADFTTDRMTFINNDSAKTSAQVITDVASYRSIRAAYFDVWAYMRDDVDGTERLTAPATWAASVAANLSPSTSLAWKGAAVKSLTRNVTKLEATRGQGQRYANTVAGVNTFMKDGTGGFVFESAVNTFAPSNPAKKTIKRTRMGIFILKSIKAGILENVDAPNVSTIQQDELTAVQTFLDDLVRNKDVDPINLPHLESASIGDVRAFNTQASLDSGVFTIPVEAKVSSDQSFIMISINYGETVTPVLEL